ncbi:uncharacterized protein [Cicer arietinum]|uniref:Uncharacterized protein LOC101508369 n=1 Tax=Cicer arietinum TaxID=3827 RepID=A0A1S3E9Q8_CICAR|nr:uncharacterized protein LOC101508369 [Cicer arietinum]XP_012572133.1 uncharacterized protein LOC101508369 [Cicer arietinum]
MEYQSLGWYQKPKGSNIKQVLKGMLLLVVCVWLLYQIKHTETKNCGCQTNLVAGYGVISLGRKGIPSRLDERAVLDSRNVDSVGDEFEYTNEKFRKNEGKKVELEQESQSKVTLKNSYKMQKNVAESAANDGLIIEETDEVQSFHDENGVPPDGNEDNVSIFSSVNWLKKIHIYEVTSGENNEVEMNLEGSMNATTADEEINT